MTSASARDLIPIARAWELVGGPSIDLSRELLQRLQARRAGQSRDDDDNG